MNTLKYIRQIFVKFVTLAKQMLKEYERLLDGFLLGIHLIYLCRFPILFLVFIIIFMPATVYQFNSLLGNFFDLTGFWDVFFFSLFACSLAISVVVSIKLILLYCAQRVDFSDQTAQLIQRRTLKLLINGPVLFIFVFISVSVLIFGAFIVVEGSNDNYFSYKVWGAVLGIISALLVLILADTTQRLINKKEDAINIKNFLIPFNPLKEWANTNTFFPRMFQRIFPSQPVKKFYRRVPSYLGRGFLLYDEEETVLNTGYIMAAAWFVFILVTYITIAIGWKYEWKIVSNIKTISYFILLLTLLCWGFSALAFFLDRYRFPVSLLIVIYFLISSLLGFDEYYKVHGLKSLEKIAPATALTAKSKNSQFGLPENYVIVVAANGGGIQSAAWTARVLTGIEKKCQEKFGQKEVFHGCGDAIRLISSVSGGSVGAMYFTNAYDENGITKDNGKLEAVVKDKSSKSSLDTVAFGLVYPDLARTLGGVFVDSDFLRHGRGSMLEVTWAERDNGKLQERLSDWRLGVKNGWRPASIFNATVAETGERLLISTTDTCSSTKECEDRSKNSWLNKENEKITVVSPPGRRNFYDVMPGVDVSVVTAARLSSSFPYVTPASRADMTKQEPTLINKDEVDKYYNYHIVDGGYFDNYGMSSLIEWLNEALTYQKKRKITKVLIVQIIGDQIIDSKLKDQNSINFNSGMIYQATAPLQTLLSLRQTGQLSHSEVELDLFIKYWKKNHIDIERVSFEYRDPKKIAAPLSWHLSEGQISKIDEEWEKISNDSNLNSDDIEVPWRKFISFICINNKEASVRNTQLCSQYF